jgi:hypothetical protein
LHSWVVDHFDPDNQEARLMPIRTFYQSQAKTQVRNDEGYHGQIEVDGVFCMMSKPVY